MGIVGFWTKKILKPLLQAFASIIPLILLIRVDGSWIVNQISMTIDATLLVTGPRINDRSVGQHGPSLLRDMDQVPVAFLALLILKGGIRLLTIVVVIVFVLGEMNHDILDAMECLGIEEINGVVWGREVTIHAVCHKSLGIVDMG